MAALAQQRERLAAVQQQRRSSSGSSSRFPASAGVDPPAVPGSPFTSQPSSLPAQSAAGQSAALMQNAVGALRPQAGLAPPPGPVKVQPNGPPAPSRPAAQPGLAVRPFPAAPGGQRAVLAPPSFPPSRPVSAAALASVAPNQPMPRPQAVAAAPSQPPAQGLAGKAAATSSQPDASRVSSITDHRASPGPIVPKHTQVVAGAYSGHTSSADDAAIADSFFGAAEPADRPSATSKASAMGGSPANGSAKPVSSPVPAQRKEANVTVSGQVKYPISASPQVQAQQIRFASTVTPPKLGDHASSSPDANSGFFDSLESGESRFDLSSPCAQCPQVGRGQLLATGQCCKIFGRTCGLSSI